MIVILLNIVILVLLTAGIWWLTGFDKGYDGVSRKDAHFSRLLRTSVAVFVIILLMWAAETGMGYAAIPILVVGIVIVAVVMRSSIAEVFAHGFMRMVDPEFHDHGPFDPKKTERYLDTIGHLIRTGQRDKAIKLCEEFKASGEIDTVTIENTLEYLGVKQNRPRATTPLQHARQMQAAGQFIEAVAELKTLLVKNPRDTEAAMLLMRIYAQNLHQRGLAEEVLKNLESQPHVYAGHIEFARRSLSEWSMPEPVQAVESSPAATPQTIDEALAQGFVGTVTERLEHIVRDEPSNFDARLKLIEVQAVYCQNLPRATRLLQELAADPWFTQEQVEKATAQLKTWHIAASKAGGAA